MTRCSTHWRVGCYLSPLLETFSLGTYLAKGVLSISIKGIHGISADIVTNLDTNVRIDTMGLIKGHRIATVVNIGYMGQGPRRIQTAYSQGYLSSLMKGLFPMVSHWLGLPSQNTTVFICSSCYNKNTIDG